MAQILKDMGITEYEPRVINQMLEFAYSKLSKCYLQNMLRCLSRCGLPEAVPGTFLTRAIAEVAGLRRESVRMIKDLGKLETYKRDCLRSMYSNEWYGEGRSGVPACLSMGEQVDVQLN